MIKKLSYIFLGMVIMVAGTVYAAPYFTYQTTLLPQINGGNDLGTTTAVWRDFFVTQICLSGSCRTSWPAGGGGGAGGTFSTSTISGYPGVLTNYPNNNTDVITIGATGTSTAKFFFDPNQNSARIGSSNTSSTTIMGIFSIPTVGQGFLYTGSAGKVNTVSTSSIFGFTPANQATTITVAGTANQITSSAGAQDLSANRTWTLSFPNQVIFPQYASTTNGFSTPYASSTQYFGANLISCNGGTNALTWANGVFGCNTISGSGTPGGSNGQVQYNGSGSFAGVATTTMVAGTNISISNSGTSYVLGAQPTIGITGQISTANGGTGLNNPGALAAGAVLRFNGSGGATAISAPASGGVLTSDGNDWLAGTVNLSSSNAVSGTLPITRGGTGSTTAPQGQLIYGGATAYQSVATTSVACSGTVTCTSFTAIGSSPITINGSSGTSASSTLLADSNYWTGFNRFYGSASSTGFSANYGFFNYIKATSTSATSTISNLAGLVDASTFPGADIGAQANAAISYASEGSTVTIPAGYRGTQTTKIVINKHITLDCQGAQLTWGGGANSTSTVLDAGTDNPYTPSWGIQNCDLKGPDDTTTVGIEVGGTLGAANAVVRGNHIIDFGFGIRTGANAYLVKFENNFLEYNNRAIHVQSPNNSGENFSFLNNTIADCDTLDKCFYSEVNGMVSANFNGNSVDDAGVWLEDGNSLSGVNNYFENPGWATIGRYNYFVTSPGGYTNVTLIGGKFTNGADNTGQSPNQYILNGGNLTLIGVGTESFNSIAVPALVVNYGGDGEQLQYFGLKDYPNSLGVYATSSVAYALGTKNSGFSAFGTTSPQYRLTSYSATAPQLSLSAGSGIPQWVFRNAGGNFYLGTTTIAGDATTTTSALTINGSTGAISLATSTAGCLNVNTLGLIYSATCSGGGVSSVTGAWPIISSGGATPNITWGGLASSSAISAGQILVATGVNTYNSISTSTLVNNIFPFTTYGLSTSSVFGFTGGLFSPASSTFSGPFRLPALSNGGLAVFNGLVSSGATTTAGTGLTYSGNAFNVNTSQNISTLSNLTSNGAVLTSGGTGALSIFAGTSCTNQFIRSLNGSISATCATVANTDLANSSITINGSSVSLGGSITVASTTLLSDLNNWTKLQTFANATSTLFSSSYSSTTDAYFGTGQGIAYIGSGGRLRTTATSTFSLSQFTNDLANLSATDSTLTFSGNYNGSVARTVGLNLGNANTWTGLQTFNNSSTTLGSFTYASSTTGFFGSINIPKLADGCINISSGLLGSTGSACGAGGGLSSYDAWTHATPGLSATTSALAISTSTNPSLYPLVAYSSTLPQLALSAGGGLSQFTFRNAGGALFISTTTIAGSATTTTAGLAMDNLGNTEWGTANIPSSHTNFGFVPLARFVQNKNQDMGVMFENLFSGTAAYMGFKANSDYVQLRMYGTSAAWVIGMIGNGDIGYLNDTTGKTPFLIDDAATSTALQISDTNVVTNAGVVLGLGGKCAANLTSDAPAALSVTSCNTLSLTSNDTTSTNRTFCLAAGTEGQMMRLFADVSGTNEIELGDGGAGACAGGTGAATFLAGVWPAATNQNNDVATLIYRTTASGAQANGWYEVARAAN